MISDLKQFNYNKELTRILLKAKTGAIAVNVLGPIMYFFIFRNSIPEQILIVWICLQFILFTFRFIFSIRFSKILKYLSQEQANSVLKKYLVFIFLNSLLWGISTIFALKYGTDLEIFILIATLFGMITGSMATLTPVLHAVFIFILNIIIVLFFSLVFIGSNEMYYIVAVFLTVYLFVSIPAAHRIHSSMRDSILLNLELSRRVEEAVSKTQAKEKILREQSRLAQMGEMISMIAHQWRQPLGAINSSIISIDLKVEMGKYNLEVKNEREEFLKLLKKKHNNVNEYVKVLSSTIDDFRNFFKHEKNQEAVSITIPIQRALSIVEGSMKTHNIEINIDFQIDTKVSMFQNEIMQVILNILKNAEDNFMEKNISNPKISIVTSEKNEKYSISIEDNGGGIEEDILVNIFDPYFSTKDEKNGTGLGLYMSKVMVEEHHDGILNVENISNDTQKGVRFEIVL